MIRSSYRYQSILTTRFVLHVLLALIILTGIWHDASTVKNGMTVSAEMEAKWTPNEKDGPALPLSMDQRQQLVQLQRAIKSAPDPNGTLEQVAQSNGMSATDLYQMIEKNAQDLQQDPQLLSELQSFAAQSSSSSSVTNTIPNMIFRFTASFFIAIRQLAKKNPQAFTMTAIIGMLLFYTLLAIPRTGLHVSSGRTLFLSNGPTTIFDPPDRYVHKLIEKTATLKKLVAPKLSIQTLKKDWDDLSQQMRRESSIDDVLNDDDINDTDDDELALNGSVVIHKLNRKKELRQAFTAQFFLSPDKILNKFLLGETSEEISTERNSIIDFLRNDAAAILLERNVLEFPSSKSKDQLRSICGNGRNDDSDDKDLCVVVVPGLGNFGLVKGYGLSYWMVTDQTGQIATSSLSLPSTLTLTTLKGKGFFDGQIHFDVRTDHDGMLIVQVSLAIPKGGRKISNKNGMRLVEEMARSILQSSSRRTQQRLARQSQGKRFKESGRSRATNRRQQRFERERLLEEMAEDRRRRWQKKNPDAGHYRPSGRRMLSPNNC